MTTEALGSLLKSPILKEFLEKNQLNFKNEQNLLAALTHKSFSNESVELSLENNERLEFLGDTVMSLIVSETLFARFPNMAEGNLSKFRSSLVNEESWAKLARALGLSKVLLVGKGELLRGGPEKSPQLADVFEALIGAIYLEKGYEETRDHAFRFFDIFEETYNEKFISIETLEQFDAKSRLQEETMKLYQVLPEYTSEELESEFVVSLSIKGKVLATTSHLSKKKGEKELAYQVLKENLHINL